MYLYKIILGSEARKPLYFVKKVEAIEGKGLEGDRYFYKIGTFNKPQLSQDVREISIFSYDNLEVCNERLDSSLSFLDLRRNLIIKDFDINQIDGRVFMIGSTHFKIVRTCPPCRYLSRLLDKDIMKGLKYIGGYRAIIIKSGVIEEGDRVIVL